jgi:hypothetical protein
MPTFDLLTPGEAARLLGDLTPHGVVAAAERGDLRVAVRTPSGRRLFAREDLETFKQQRADRRAMPQVPVE